FTADYKTAHPGRGRRRRRTARRHRGPRYRLHRNRPKKLNPKGRTSTMPAKRPLYNLDRPLTRSDFKTYATELSELQGNILRTHGRGAALHLFLTFKPRKQAEVKQFLREFAGVVTSMAKQLADARRHRKTGKAEHFLNFLCLSAKGYKYF